jgi:hypothetical protein
VGADDLAPGQDFNGMICALALVKELGKVGDHGCNFRLGRTHRIRPDKACHNETGVVVTSIDHNNATRGVHVNPAGFMEVRSSVLSANVACIVPSPLRVWMVLGVPAGVIMQIRLLLIWVTRTLSLPSVTMPHRCLNRACVLSSLWLPAMPLSMKVVMVHWPQTSVLLRTRLLLLSAT